MFKRQTLIALAASSMLAACIDADPLANPNEFLFEKWDGDLSGTYNPAGFTSGEVQAQIARACLDEQISGYVEIPRGTSLIGFTAACVTSGFGESASYLVERTSFGISLTEQSAITFP